MKFEQVEAEQSSRMPINVWHGVCWNWMWHHHRLLWLLLWCHTLCGDIDALAGGTNGNLLAHLWGFEHFGAYLQD